MNTNLSALSLIIRVVSIALAFAFQGGALAIDGETQSSEALLNKLNDIWAEQRNQITSGRAEFHRTARVTVRNKPRKSIDDVKSALLATDALGESGETHLAQLIFSLDPSLDKNKPAWTDYDLIESDGQLRVERKFGKDFRQLSVNDGANEIIQIPGANQISIYSSGQSEIEFKRLGDIRFIPPRFSAATARATIGPDGVVTINAKSPKADNSSVELTADAESGFVYTYSLKRPRQGTEQYIVQQGPTEYEDGVILPTLFARFDFDSAELSSFEVIALKTASINTDATPEAFVVASDAPDRVADFRQSDSDEAEIVAKGKVEDVVGVADQAALSREAGKVHPIMPEVKNGESSRFWFYVNIALVAIIAVVIVWRKFLL